jgi:hypothetical protein
MLGVPLPDWGIVRKDGVQERWTGDSFGKKTDRCRVLKNADYHY